MKISPSIVLGILCSLWLCCSPLDPQSVPNTQHKKKISLTSAVKVKGEYILPNNILPPSKNPLRGTPNSQSIHSLGVSIGAPSILPFTNVLTEKRLNGPSMIPPDSLWVEGQIIQFKHPIPTPSIAMQKKDGARMHIRYMDVYQGMNAPSVYDIIEDRRGNIWFATVGGGVSKYDGHRFYHFTTEHGLSHNIVKCILEDSKGNLWFGTLGGGLNKYDGDKFTHYTLEQGLKSNYILSLLEDKNGHIWIGTDKGGVHQFIPDYQEKGELLITLPFEGKRFQNIICMTEDREGHIWMGTWDGAFRYSPNKEIPLQGSISYFTQKDGLNGKSVLSIIEDKFGNIWFGTQENGVTIYLKDKNQLAFVSEKQGLPHPVVYDMLEDQLGNIWLGSDGGGVSKINFPSGVNNISSGSLSYINVENGLSHNNVLSLMEDHEGNIWLGTWGGGVNRFTPTAVSHLTMNDGLPSNDLRAVIEDRQGDLWIGTWGGGIVHYEFSSKSKEDGRLTNYTTGEGLSLDNILSLSEDKQGDIWIGTAGGGVVHFDRTENVFTQYDGQTGLSGYGVNTILEDRAGNLWFGIEGGGVSRYSPTPDSTGSYFTHFTTKEGLKHNSVSSILEDKHGNIWFGTKAGLVCFSPDKQGRDGTFRYLTQQEGLSNNLIVSMLEDHEGNLWFGTWGGGLHKFTPNETVEGGNLQIFTTESGLNNDWIMSLTQDESNNIWVNTLKGLTLIKPIEKQTEVEAADYSFITLGEAEGLNRTGFWWNNICLDEQNRLWWGTSNGLAMLKVEDFSLQSPPPRLSLATLQINQQYVDYRRIKDSAYKRDLPLVQSIHKAENIQPFTNYPNKLELPYYLNHLTFHFSGIDWKAPQKISYTYEMEGINDGQTNLSQENKADYTNLSYGDYTFKVKAKGASNTWSESISYSFSINPPWWHTWWARGLYICIFTVLGYFVYRYQLRRQLAAEETRRLLELDRFKTRFFTNITHEFRTPITVISGMTQHIKGHLRQKQLIRRNSQRLLQLVNQLMDLSKLEEGYLPLSYVQEDIVSYLSYLTQSFHSLADMRDIHISFASEEQEVIMDYDPERVQQILTNLLSNAIKFTEAQGEVIVLASKTQIEENNYLQVEVRDTGQGIPSEDLPHIFDRFYQSESNLKAGGTGVGLALVKELMEQMKGTLTVESQVGKGTSFKFSLPIHREAPLSITTEYPSITHTEPKESYDSPTIETDEKLANILIVEDNLDVSTYIEQCLVPSYQIKKAFDGEVGLQTALMSVPDLIITDVMMPKMDGYELTRHLKSDRITSHIPVIMLTAKASEPEKLEGLEHGADAYLIKPFNEQELHLRIRNLLDVQQRWQERFQQDPTDIPQKPESLDDKFLKAAKQLVMDHLDNSEYSIEQFADGMNLSRSQLHRKLKALTGFSATQYMNNIRLTKAHQMLLEEDITIAEAAYSTGFETPNYFARLYKKKFGQTPSETIK